MDDVVSFVKPASAVTHSRKASKGVDLPGDTFHNHNPLHSIRKPTAVK
jgi:hypothetical protein